MRKEQDHKPDATAIREIAHGGEARATVEGQGHRSEAGDPPKAFAKHIHESDARMASLDRTSAARRALIGLGGDSRHHCEERLDPDKGPQEAGRALQNDPRATSCERRRRKRRDP